MDGKSTLLQYVAAQMCQGRPPAPLLASEVPQVVGSALKISVQVRHPGQMMDIVHWEPKTLCRVLSMRVEPFNMSSHLDSASDTQAHTLQHLATGCLFFCVLRVLRMQVLSQHGTARSVDN